MEKEKKNRSGSQSNNGPGNGETHARGKSSQPGEEVSNRQTGGSKRHERDDSNGGAERNTTKKGENAV